MWYVEMQRMWVIFGMGCLTDVRGQNHIKVEVRIALEILDRKRGLLEIHTIHRLHGGMSHADV